MVKNFWIFKHSTVRVAYFAMILGIQSPEVAFQVSVIQLKTDFCTIEVMMLKNLLKRVHLPKSASFFFMEKSHQKNSSLTLRTE